MTIDSLAMGISIACGALSVISLGLSVTAIIMVEAQRRSTHKIEWRALSPDEVQSPQEMNKLLNAELEENEYDQI